MKILLRKKLTLRKTAFVICASASFFINKKISNANTKNYKYGLIIHPFEVAMTDRPPFIGQKFIYASAFYEYSLHKNWGINTSLGYYMSDIGFLGPSFTDHYIVFPLSIKFYPFIKNFSVFVGTEFYLHITTKEYVPKNVDNTSISKNPTGPPIYKKYFSNNSHFSNISHFRWIAGIDYETNFGLIFGYRYDSTLSNSINENNENLHHNTSNSKLLLGVNLPQIFDFAKTKSQD